MNSLDPWTSRAFEERSLLNPSFCSNLIWNTAIECTKTGERHLSFTEAFLILPFTLHSTVRQKIPKSIKTSLTVWINDNPLIINNIIKNSQELVSYTKEALLFSGTNNFIQIRQNNDIIANEKFKSTVNKINKSGSDEVRDCIAKSKFIGRWFASTGNATTVMALIGVRP